MDDSTAADTRQQRQTGPGPPAPHGRCIHVQKMLFPCFLFMIFIQLRRKGTFPKHIFSFLINPAIPLMVSNYLKYL